MYGLLILNMPSNQLVSIIIPAYNQAEYLADALDSVVQQAYTNWECIVVNDGSTDHTSDVVRSYQSRCSRIYCYEQDNKGLAGARNSGLRQAKGSYIQFLDADDAIHKDKLQLQMDLLSSTDKMALSISDYVSSTEQSLLAPYPFYCSPKVGSEDPLRELIMRWEISLSIPNHCYLFDARIFREHEILFDEQLPNHEDWDCWVRVFRLNPRIFYVDQKLATYRIRSNSMARDNNANLVGFIAAINEQKSLCIKDSLEYRLLTRKLWITRITYKLRVIIKIGKNTTIVKRLLARRLGSA